MYQCSQAARPPFLNLALAAAGSNPPLVMIIHAMNGSITLSLKSWWNLSIWRIGERNLYWASWNLVASSVLSSMVSSLSKQIGSLESKFFSRSGPISRYLKIASTFYISMRVPKSVLLAPRIRRVSSGSMAKFFWNLGPLSAASIADSSSTFSRCLWGMNFLETGGAVSTSSWRISSRRLDTTAMTRLYSLV